MSTETCCIVIVNNDVIHWISILWIASQARNDEKAGFLKVLYRKSTVYYDAYLNAALATKERISPSEYIPMETSCLNSALVAKEKWFYNVLYG